jgi:light-regulated signal transduction histidine kinase (bacteriophytochrome)
MISSYTQLLERRYKDKLDDEANEFIHFAVDGANRMQMMITDLLEYSRITTRGKELKEIAVSITLEKVISILQLKIDDSSTIITNDTLPLVKGDESQLFRVFQNLIENAIKFKKKSENPKIHISCQKKNEFYEFSVKDNGIGMDMKYKDKLFIIFSRLHSSKEYPGTGMGLSICKRIIERHGGKIWFDSKVNEGTTFYFTLPV